MHEFSVIYKSNKAQFLMDLSRIILYLTLIPVSSPIALPTLACISKSFSIVLSFVGLCGDKH